MSQDHWILHRILQSRETILANLNQPKVIRGLKTYCWLQSNLPKDVTVDPYRRKYIGFYRVRRPGTWLDKYFSLLQEQKANNTISFAHTLRTLSTPKRIEAVFISKLVATVRPDMPPIDKWVISNLCLTRPAGSPEQRINGWVGLHSYIRCLYKSLIQQDMFKEIQDYFDSSFQQFPGLTDVKKLDILLWQLR